MKRKTRQAVSGWHWKVVALGVLGLIGLQPHPGLAQQAVNDSGYEWKLYLPLPLVLPATDVFSHLRVEIDGRAAQDNREGGARLRAPQLGQVVFSGREVFCCPRKVSDHYRLIIQHPNSIFTVWSSPIEFLPRVGDRVSKGASLSPAVAGSMAFELEVVRILDATLLKQWTDGSLTSVPDLGEQGARLQRLDIPTLMNLTVLDLDAQSVNLQLQLSPRSPSGDEVGPAVALELSAKKPRAQLLAAPGQILVNGSIVGLFGRSTPPHLRTGISVPVSGEGERAFASLGDRYSIRYRAADHHPTLAALIPVPDAPSVTEAVIAGTEAPGRQQATADVAQVPPAAQGEPGRGGYSCERGICERGCRTRGKARRRAARDARAAPAPAAGVGASEAESTSRNGRHTQGGAGDRQRRLSICPEASERPCRCTGHRKEP
jgi:hypothetical protein